MLTAAAALYGNINIRPGEKISSRPYADTRVTPTGLPDKSPSVPSPRSAAKPFRASRYKYYYVFVYVTILLPRLSETRRLLLLLPILFPIRTDLEILSRAFNRRKT